MKHWKRILYSVILVFIPGARKRTEFMRKHHLYGSIGENCLIQKEKSHYIPILFFFMIMLRLHLM